jgi:hypothetical protein
MIRTIPAADREALEQGLRRLKLRHMREHLDDINELALQEEPSFPSRRVSSFAFS